MKRLLLIMGAWFLLSIVPAGASEKFYTRHDVTYSFDSQGIPQVQQRISLTNKESGFYASAYQISLSGDPPGIITGFDSQGPLQIDLTHPDPETTVANVKFNDQVVGIDQTLTFTLNYTGRLAEHNGQVWEILLPKLGNTTEIDEYNLELKVPQSFGYLAFISPSPNRAGDRTYRFTKDQIAKTPVVAAFGNFQAYDFILTYELTNPDRRPGIAQVAIPADTNYQRIMYSSIEPQPDKIERDGDGNWLATFTVGGNSTVIATAVGQAHLLAEPTKTYPGLSVEQRTKYTQSTPYWPADDPQIVNLARQLKTPEAIHTYVVNTLTYDESRLASQTPRKGGLMALTSPSSSVCTEFTDLFITLARAAGIPAREVNGYGYTTEANRPRSLGNNSLHAWPQYWDDRRQTWISIDPTWQNTTGGIDYFNKLDFNHFAFIVRGESDTTPALVTSKAEVKYGVYKDFPLPSPTVVWKPPFQLLPLVNNSSTLSITNPLGVAMYQVPVTAQTLNVQSHFSGPSEIDVILPFSTHEYNLAIQPPFWPEFSVKKVVATVASNTEIYNIEAQLFLTWQITLGIITAIIVTSVGWLTTKAWGVYLQKPGRGSVVRGQGQKP